MAVLLQRDLSMDIQNKFLASIFFIICLFWRNCWPPEFLSVCLNFCSNGTQNSPDVHKSFVCKFGFTPPPLPLKGPKMRKKTAQISRKSSKLTIFRGGGQRNFMNRTILSQILGVSEISRSHCVLQDIANYHCYTPF